MSSQRRSGFPFAKIVVGLALAFIAGVGLCGLDYFLGSRGVGRGGGQQFSVGPLDAVSLIVMILSLAGLVLMLIVWALSAIVGSLRRSGDDPQKLLDKKDESDLKS
jgi:hypothetical protein